MRNPGKTLTMTLALALAVAAPLAVEAQATATKLVRLHDVSGGSVQAPEALFPEFRLRAQFSMLEPNGAIVNQDIEKTSLKFVNQVFAGTAGKLTGDWSVSLLVDTSQTMASGNGAADFKKATDALSKQIDRAGDSAFLSLITFDDSPRIVQDLAKDREELKKKLTTGIFAKGSGKSCLNQGLFEAVRRVKDLPTRRAVFVLTASQDTCETPSAQSVIDLARQNKVQIYAVGLDGYTISKAALERFTEPTGGLALMTNAGEAIITIGNQMSLLANQWETAYAFFPAKGAQTAEMNLTLKDGSLVSRTLSFEVDRDYFPPPKIALKGEVQTLSAGLVFNLDITTKDKIKRVETRVTNKRTAAEVYRESLTDFAPSNTIKPAKLENGLEYILTVIAFDDQNRPISTDQREFAFKPPEFVLAIERVEPPTFIGTGPAASSFSVTVRASNPQAVTRYQLYLENTNANNAVIVASEVFLQSDSPLLIPTKDLTPGTYVVRVRAFASDQALGGEAARSAPVAFAPPSGMDIFMRQARDNPILLIGLLGAVLLAVVVLVTVNLMARNRSLRAEKVVEAALPVNPRRSAPVSAEPQVAAVPQFAPPPPAGYPPPQSAYAAAPPAMPSAPPMSQQVRAGGQPTAILTLKNAATGWEGRISQASYTVGRAADNNGVLPVDGTSGVSSRHLLITHDQAGWHITDLSRNGTTINGQRIPPNQAVPLPNGVVLGLGPTIKVEFRSLS